MDENKNMFEGFVIGDFFDFKQRNDGLIDVKRIKSL